MKDIEKLMRIVEFVDTGYQGTETTRGYSFRYGYWIAAACAIALILLIVPFSRNRTPGLVDTYDSPELAYAKLEQSFNRIGTTMEKGITLTETTYNKIRNGNNE